MTGARAKHNREERAIAKALDLTDAQLDGLLAIKAGRWPGNAAACLLAKGLAYRSRDMRESGLTEQGAAMLARARSMGF